ncbi:MAG: hypothetical protein JWO92_1125 [Chitinophagaceae bacterium]|nr:hypothetical protein [Chitinophagaceae bacterium]
MSHTKGKWKYDSGIVYSDGGIQPHICNMTDFFNPEVTGANGKLIAAAPDLLEAAIEINNLIIDNGKFCNTIWHLKLKEAIKKATT